MFDRLRSLLRFGQMPEEKFLNERERILEAAPIPVMWLFGKTGSGKTSIIKDLTGAEEAEIGNGFRPETKFSAEYDFPTSENPVIRFLDTRGLGEGNYDPQEDIDSFDKSADVVIVTARVMDHALANVVGPLNEMRRHNPERPVLLALTHLHEAYPQQQHLLDALAAVRGVDAGAIVAREKQRCRRGRGAQWRSGDLNCARRSMESTGS